PLPCRGAVKVNHLIADVNGNGLRIFRNLQPKQTIKRHHGFRVLHRKSHMIEASNIARLLHPACSSKCNHASDELSAGNALCGFHGHVTVAASYCSADARHPYYSLRMSTS